MVLLSIEMRRVLYLILLCFILKSIDAQTFVLRYDDFSNFSRSDIDEYLLRIHDSLEVPINIGVVAWSAETRNSLDYKNLNRNKLIAWNNSFHIPFVHGLTHTKRRTNSEFVGGAASDQYRDIFESKARLDSIFFEDIRCWSAPYNSYDSTSLVVCKELGFEHVFCSSKHGPVLTGLRFVPSTVGLMDFFKFPNKMQFDVSDTVVIQFHDYNFGKSFTKADYLSWLKNCIEQGVNFVGYAEVGMTSKRYQSLLSYCAIKRYLPYVILPKNCFTYDCQDCLWIFLKKFCISAFILVGLLIYGALKF
jgi:hypothetical protein